MPALPPSPCPSFSPEISRPTARDPEEISSRARTAAFLAAGTRTGAPPLFPGYQNIEDDNPLERWPL